jgi:cell division protease FtsH
VNRFLRSALFPVVVITLIVWLGTQTLLSHKTKTKKETLSQLYSLVQTQPTTIKEVVFNPNKHQVQVQLDDSTKFNVNYASDQSQADLQKQLEENSVPFDSKGIGTSAWWTILTSLLPFVLLFGFWIFLMNQVQGGGSKVMSFGKSRAKRMTPDSPKIGFKDVAGVDESVVELL